MLCWSRDTCLDRQNCEKNSDQQKRCFANFGVIGHLFLLEILTLICRQFARVLTVRYEMLNTHIKESFQCVYTKSSESYCFINSKVLLNSINNLQPRVSRDLIIFARQKLAYEKENKFNERTFANEIFIRRSEIARETDNVLYITSAVSKLFDTLLQSTKREYNMHV